ncbi:helix-turn-helix transcriptional regulator [Streptomyces sp. NPDC050610]|uniref:helix-turn-helix domain-containing protein n=1 Tax=Streptomyces sp. NPDC050610 TaxID=3157097 RepID=UPI0034432745
MRRRNAQDGQAVTVQTPGAVFGELLKHYRQSAGYSQDELAGKIPCDRSTLARVESGTRVPQESFARLCDELLGTGGALLKLWRKIEWYPAVEHPDWFRRRARMDAATVSLREYQTQVVPGLLQSEDYARALFAQVDSGELLEERVAARLSRQRRFLAADGPLLMAVLDESALRTVVGSSEVMHGQCAHLLSVGRRANIRIQVAPAAPQTAIVRPNTSMSLITLPDGQEWVYSESLDRGYFSDDPAAHARHARTYDVLRADALSAFESAALIRRFMEGYGSHDHRRSQRGDVDQEQLQRKQRRKLRRGGPRHRYPRRPRS